MSIKNRIGRLLPEKVVYLVWQTLRHFPVQMMKIFGAYFGLFATSPETASDEGKETVARVLVLHGLEPESRQTTVDYVAAFLGSSRSVDLTVANVFGFMPNWLGEVEFDLAIVTTEALSHRTTPFWSSLEKRIVKAMKSTRRKVLMPQDDYTDSAKLDALAIKAGVNTIYSPLIKGLDLIYPKATKTGVQFVEALTGYFEQEKVNARVQMSLPFRERTVDIGQRVRKLPPQFGEIGIRKYEIAAVLSDSARERGLQVDFSSDPTDVLLGEEWFRFLGSTKFTVSCRGGSSVIDSHGKIAARLANLKKYFPHMDESRAFKIASFGQMKTGDFDAVSPRLFDAAMMGVCQILLEDDYMGMEPWVHYIPLKRDYSNIDEVFAAMEKPGLAEQIVENSKKFLLDPERFSYNSLVEQMLEKELGSSSAGGGNSKLTDVDALLTMIPGEHLRESFTRLSSLARGRLKLGLTKFAADGLLRNDFPELRLRSSLDATVLENWITSFFRKPVFPEILIVRWCPLSWFLDQP